jgi:quercetin dioxygenase-like cupin family protein
MELRTTPATVKGPDTTFTGDVWLDRIAGGDDESHLVAATVRFTPGARTHWHSHPLGQTLHCTDGVGLVGTRDGRVIVLRPGGTVWTPPGEEHWHGATRDNLMCHLALVVVLERRRAHGLRLHVLVRVAVLLGQQRLQPGVQRLERAPVVRFNRHGGAIG